MKIANTFVYILLLVGFMLLLASCTKKVMMDKAKAQPKVEIKPPQQTNRPIENHK